MKFFLFTLLVLFSFSSFSQEEICNEETVYLLNHPTANLLNLPKSCFDKEIIIGIPEEDKDKLNVHIMESLNQTFITLNSPNFMDGYVYANDCHYGGDIELADRFIIYGMVTVDNKYQYIDVQHTQLYSLFKFDYKKLEISPVAGQHFLYSNPRMIDSSFMSIQPSNVGVNLKIKKEDLKKRPIKINFNVGPGIDIDQSGGKTEYKITPSANLRLAIPL